MLHSLQEKASGRPHFRSAAGSRRCSIKFCQSRAAVHADAAALTNEAGESDLRAFDRLARALADAQSAGCAPVLILSAAGARQAETAVSLCRNVFLFTKFLTEYGCRAAERTHKPRRSE